MFLHKACHPDCNVGLMRCSGTASSQCCVAFEDDGACSPDLDCEENNFAANEQNDFTCGQSKINIIYEVCVLLSPSTTY